MKRKLAAPFRSVSLLFSLVCAIDTSERTTSRWNDEFPVYGIQLTERPDHDSKRGYSTKKIKSKFIIGRSWFLVAARLLTKCRIQLFEVFERCNSTTANAVTSTWRPA
ncbi:hypothetical protein BDR07DRAFT_1331959 [Suillus spraguei]|nr:hypothetical protein BDR07DRAFT_1331959 [Suillus spraguei]